MREMGDTEVTTPEPSGNEGDSSETSGRAADGERPARSETAAEAPGTQPGESGPAQPAAEVPAAQDGQRAESSGESGDVASDSAAEPGEIGPVEPGKPGDAQGQATADPSAEADPASADINEVDSAAQIRSADEPKSAGAEPGEVGPAEEGQPSREAEGEITDQTGGDEPGKPEEPLAQEPAQVAVRDSADEANEPDRGPRGTNAPEEDLAGEAARAADGAADEPATPGGPHGGVRTTEALHSFGGPKEGPPRAPRPEQDFGVSSTADRVGPYQPGAPTDRVGGSSTFTRPEHAPLTGNYHELPAGTELPKGMGVHADGSDVGGNMRYGHRTLYPTTSMSVSEFQDLFRGLKWKYAGKK